MMAHFWIPSDSGEWAAARLEQGPMVLHSDGPGMRPRLRSQEAARTDNGMPADAVVVRRYRAESDTWVVVAPSTAAVRVNGWPLHLGLRVLRDRDEVCLGDTEPCFFSTERLARVEAMGEPASPVVCPRCQQPIAGGSPAVCCPGCGVFHHQSEELPCWYGYKDEPFASCAVCDRTAAPGATFQWTPDGL
jgi:hypothetical protein